LLPDSNKPTVDSAAKNTKLPLRFINLYQNSPILIVSALRQKLHTTALRRTSGRSIGIILTRCSLLSTPFLTFVNRIDILLAHLHYRYFRCLLPYFDFFL
jgi:hypothetical protein